MAIGLTCAPLSSSWAIETNSVSRTIFSSGKGGIEFIHDCDSESLVTGIKANSLDWRDLQVLTRLQGICSEVTEDGEATTDKLTFTETNGLSQSGSPSSISCPASYAVIGANVYNETKPTLVSGIELRCGKLLEESEIVLTNLIGEKTGSLDELRCPKNTFASGLYVRFGEVIDSFGLRCAQIQGALQKTLKSVTLSATEKIYPYSVRIGIDKSSGGSGTGLLSITRVSDGSATGCALVEEVISSESPGTCIIEVTKAGDIFYAPTSIETQFNFLRSGQSIQIESLASVDAAEGLSQELSPVLLNLAGSGEIAFSVRDGSATGCALLEADSSQQLTATSYGTCLISATIAADNNYEAATSDEVAFTFSEEIAAADNEKTLGDKTFPTYNPVEDAENVVDLQIAAFALLALAATGSAAAGARSGSKDSSDNARRRDDDENRDASQASEDADDKEREDQAGEEDTNSDGANQNSNDEERESGDVASASANKLPFYKRTVGVGDNSILWRLAHTPRIERKFLTWSGDFSRFSPVLSRVLIDGSYLRAMFSSLAFLPSIFGAIIAIMMLIDSDQQAIPASLILVAMALGLSTIDALAGLSISSILLVGTLVSGNIDTLDEWMTLFGLSALFLTPGLVASSVRPFRRLVGDRHSAWERITDYALATMIGGWSVEKIIGALNGLAGLQLPITESARDLGQLVALCIFMRLILEDLATYFFPERLAQQAVEPKDVSPLQPWFSLTFKTLIFYLVAYQFLGFGSQLLLGTAIFVFPQIFSNLTSHVTLKKTRLFWFLVPRGAPKIIVMVFVGGFFANWVQSQFSSPLQYLSWSFVLLALPGLAIALFAIFAKSPAKKWNTGRVGTAIYRVGGFVIALLILSMYQGTDLYSALFGA